MYVVNKFTLRGASTHCISINKREVIMRGKKGSVCSKLTQLQNIAIHPIHTSGPVMTHWTAIADAYIVHLSYLAQDINRFPAI